MSDRSGTGPKRPPASRLFFALWPSEAQQQALEQTMRARVESTRGRAIPARNLHVTLAFLGSVLDSRLENVTACAGKLRGRAFELRWDQLEIWARSHVLCLTTSRMPSQLTQLEEQLRFNLLNAQFEIRQEEYRPHVTLARDVQRRNKLEPIVPIGWPFEEFVLAQSRPGPSGSEYTVLERWALASE